MISNFSSDNIGQADHKFIESLKKCNVGFASAYGNDKWSKNLESLLVKLTGLKLRFFTCFTGSGANLLAITILTPRHGSVLCHLDSHIALDETSGPEFFIGGKIVSVGKNYKLTLPDIIAAINKAKQNAPFEQPIKTMSVSQTNEWGLVYTMEELLEIKQLCDRENIKLHIDGARIHTALKFLKITFAEFIKTIKPATISLGTSKNGGIFGDILIVFEEKYWEMARYLQRKFGNDVSKSRFISSQLLDYLKEDYWLQQAERSILMAKKLENIFNNNSSIELLLPVQTNMVFVCMNKETVNFLNENYIYFSSWSLKKDCYRFVVNPLTPYQHVEHLRKTLNKFKLYIDSL